MAYSLQNTTDLIALGNAIRAKTGGASNLTVAEMATAVASITGGGGGGYHPSTITNITANASEGKYDGSIDLSNYENNPYLIVIFADNNSNFSPELGAVGYWDGSTFDFLYGETGNTSGMMYLLDYTNGILSYASGNIRQAFLWYIIT